MTMAATRITSTDATDSLVIDDLTLRIGGIVALKDVTLRIDPGEIVGLIGPNGAGKTSLINCLTGVYRYQSGSVHLGSRDLSNKQAHVVAAAGVARTFQQANLVAGLTVAENLLLARHSKMKAGVVWEALRVGRGSREERTNRAYVDDLLEWFGIRAWRSRTVDNLSLWEQKQVVVARALAAQPSMVLLDEPAAGLSTVEKQSLLALLARIRDELGVGELVIEHDLPFVSTLCSRVIVLALGQRLAEGTPHEVLAHADVIEAYLGGVAYEATNDYDDNRPTAAGPEASS